MQLNRRLGSLVAALCVAIPASVWAATPKSGSTYAYKGTASKVLSLNVKPGSKTMDVYCTDNKHNVQLTAYNVRINKSGAFSYKGKGGGTVGPGDVTSKVKVTGTFVSKKSATGSFSGTAKGAKGAKVHCDFKSFTAHLVG